MCLSLSLCLPVSLSLCHYFDCCCWHRQRIWYRVQSHLWSVWPSACQLFFSIRIGFLDFHPIFLIFGLNAHISIAQEFLLFFNGSLITKKYVKNGNIRGFWPYSQTVFNMTPWNLLYWYIVGTFRCVWKMVLAGQICGPFLTPNNQNNSMYRFSPIFLKSSHWIHTKLGL